MSGLQDPAYARLSPLVAGEPLHRAYAEKTILLPLLLLLLLLFLLLLTSLARRRSFAIQSLFSFLFFPFSRSFGYVKNNIFQELVGSSIG